jgi:transposase-like protein
MSGTKGMTHYSLETKLLAMQLHEQDGLPYAQVAEKLDIRILDRIKAWYRAYRREGELAFHKHIGRPNKQQPQETHEALRRENALLKKFQSELHKGMLARRNIGSSSTTEELTQ